MKYKNYRASLDFDAELGMFHGRVTNTHDVITYYGKTVVDANREFKNSVEDYLEFCKKLGEEPEIG